MNNKKLRIVMLCEYYPPFDRGGSEWSVYYLARSLAKKGAHIDIVTPNYGAAAQEVSGETMIYRFPFIKKLKKSYEAITPWYHSNLLWFITTTFFLLLHCLKFHPTHLHVQGKYFLPAAIFIGALLKIQVIVTIRDYIILCPLAYCIQEERGYIACSLFSLLTRDLPLSQRIHGHSGSVIQKTLTTVVVFRGWLISKLLFYCMKNVNYRVAISKKLQRIYAANGMHIETVVYNSMTFSRQKILRKGNYLLYIGRLSYGKGFDLLISAYKIIFKAIRVPLYVLGNGSFQTLLQQSGVFWKGQVPHIAVQSYIKNSLAVIVPSRWEEPFGRVALEALAAGIPVVATARGGLGEIVTSGKTGYVVSATVRGIVDGIKKVKQNNSSLRKTMYQNRSMLRQKFSTNPVNQYWQIYQRL